jgi:hypothetical protein
VWTDIRGIVLALVLAGGMLPTGSQLARANEDVSDCDDIDPEEEHLNEQLEGWVCLADALSPLKQPLSVESKQAAIATPAAGIQRLATVDGTLQPGEPKEPGMTRTGWVSFKAPNAARIVVHTFGSKAWDSGVFDPLLAAYHGKALNNLSRITGNDNKPLAGISNVQSLIQFNTVAGNYYSIQIGGKNGIEGDVSLNVFSFPPSGGLSAFLIQYNGFPFNARDYSCELTTTTASVFCNAKFIVHNSTSKVLTVTPSTTLGAGVTGPAPFSLAPGALKVVTFVFNATTFNKTIRTVSGHFIFTGRSGGTVVTEARHRALVVVRPNTRIDDLIASKATPQVQTTHTNVPVAFTSTITNKGSVTAIGCHLRSGLYSDLKTIFYEINPANGQRVAADNAPRNIAAGQSRTFKVLVASQGARDADFIDPEVVADCANNRRSQFSLLRGLDVSALAVAEPLPSLSLTSSVPANGVLTVPGTGFAYYTFRAKNTQTTKSLDALPAYVGPFDDPANSNYPVAICRTNLSTGNCIGHYASSVTYTAAKGTVFGFSVRVKAAQVATPLDPDQRRVYVNFKQTNVPYFHIAAPSIAVKRP